jgi:outer membrane autotransporter protein
MNPKLKLIILCALSASALNAFAQNKVVNGVAAPAESDQTYAAVSGTAALYVYNPGASYSGTNIVLSATFDTGNGRMGAMLNNQASLALVDGSIFVTGSNGVALYVSNTSAAVLNNVKVDSSVQGITFAGSATLTMVGGTISTLGGDGYGVTLMNSNGDLRDVHILTSGSRSYGMNFSGSTTVTVANLNVQVLGDRAYGITMNNTADIRLSFSGSNVDIVTSGSRGVGLTVGGYSTAAIIDYKVRTTGETAYGALVTNGGTSSLYLVNADIQTDGADAEAIMMTALDGGHKILVIAGGSLAAQQADGITINKQEADSDTPDATWTGTYDITLKSGAVLTGQNALYAATTYTGTGAHERLALVTVKVEEAAVLNGNVQVMDKAVVTMYLSGSSALNGAVNGSGSSNTVIHFDNSTLSGDLTATEDATLIVSGSRGTAITGDIIGSGTATIDVTLSGSNSTLLGDITENDAAVVTVTISDSAVGTGGFAGGNLITGGDSTRTFNKDSHGNSGENHGTWNIGDYEVIFDNLTHTGTINLNVNSDTGAGGSITVTDTADGDGTVHINTTGDGQLNPNDVLPGKVTGDGTEHWQWDPINWGIDTIIKDGDHFIKSGVSPAGAVLNSSVAIQQAMWFAQQNSLLKRMGELRFSSSRQLVTSSADKAVTLSANNLIENIWLRSYGQQLNIGSKVSGKAYEQLIYGVDLGTDHKFTISADSDLYLGVYAGYGRSDIDYRTPNTDGELNSYYGGLYATWLHSSGFYLDATIKAASVDNDLKAPYGATQLNANYSDVNIGGSIEIGKKFTFADDWFIEPQFQINYLHILAEDYQAGPMSITTSDLDALQLRLGSLFGRTIKLTNSGALQPYLKISGVETISTGGTLRNGYQSTRANTDGARAELGGGLIWQLDASNQLHLDYEASFGDKYDKPWGLTAGYRHQF